MFCVVLQPWLKRFRILKQECSNADHATSDLPLRNDDTITASMYVPVFGYKYFTFFGFQHENKCSVRLEIYTNMSCIVSIIMINKFVIIEIDIDRCGLHIICKCNVMHATSVQSGAQFEFVSFNSLSFPSALIRTRRYPLHSSFNERTSTAAQVVQQHALFQHSIDVCTTRLIIEKHDLHYRFNKAKTQVVR